VIFPLVIYFAIAGNVYRAAVWDLGANIENVFGATEIYRAKIMIAGGDIRYPSLQNIVFR
jgi:hypothetical protein